MCLSLALNKIQNLSTFGMRANPVKSNNKHAVIICMVHENGSEVYLQKVFEIHIVYI